MNEQIIGNETNRKIWNLVCSLEKSLEDDAIYGYEETFKEIRALLLDD